MARKKSRINSWMLRKRGIAKRFSVKPGVRVRNSNTSPNQDMPQFFDARRPPQKGVRYFVNEQTGKYEKEVRAHPWREPVVERPETDPLLMVEARRKWLNELTSGHGTSPIYFKRLKERKDLAGKIFWELRLYFSGMRQQFVIIHMGEVISASIVYYGELARVIELWKAGREKAIRWRESI